MLWLKDTQSKNSIMHNFGPVLGQKSVPPPGLYQTCWDDRNIRNSCRSKTRGGTNNFARDNMEKFQILSSLVLNLDQSNSTYVSMGKTAMAEKGSDSVPISGLSDKRSMTATFTITLNGKFLPIQLIYEGKTKLTKI